MPYYSQRRRIPSGKGKQVQNEAQAMADQFRRVIEENGTAISEILEQNSYGSWFSNVNSLLEQLAGQLEELAESGAPDNDEQLAIMRDRGFSSLNLL